MSLRWTGLIDIKKDKLFFYNDCMMLIESPMSLLHTKLVMTTMMTMMNMTTMTTALMAMVAMMTMATMILTMMVTSVTADWWPRIQTFAVIISYSNGIYHDCNQGG